MRRDYIAQGDCLDLMRQLSDKSVDLIVTDPPYGKKADKGTNGFGSSKNRRYRGGGIRKSHQKKFLMRCSVLPRMWLSLEAIIFATSYLPLIAGFSGIRRGI